MAIRPTSLDYSITRGSDYIHRDPTVPQPKAEIVTEVSDYERELSERRKIIDEALELYKQDAQWIEQNIATPVIEAIRQHGSLSFDKLMSLVLYNPTEGYYASGEAKINSGDFSTLVSNPEHVIAFFSYFARYLPANGAEPQILSVASGAGHFEYLLAQVHKHVQMVTQGEPVEQNSRYPEKIKIIAYDVSESLLKKQEDPRNIDHLKNLLRERQAELTDDGRVLQSLANGISWSISVQDLIPLFSQYDCTAELFEYNEYQSIFNRFILPELKKIVLNQFDENSAEYTAALFLFTQPDAVLFRELALDFTPNTSEKIVGSALDLQFDDDSLDIVFSNELHDQFADKIFRFDQTTGEYYEIFVGFDETTQSFTLEEKIPSLISGKLLDLQLMISQETGKIAFDQEYDQNGLQNFLVVNMGSIQFLKEAARVLKPGSICVNADYVGKINGKYFDSMYFLRSDGSGKYHHFTRLSEYKQPWKDVTSDMNPAVLEWAGAAFGLQVIHHETQNSFTQRFSHLTSMEKPSFEVIILQKKSE